MESIESVQPELITEEKDPSKIGWARLWNGFEAVCKKTEDGFQNLKEIQEFFQQRAKIEEEYSKKLEMLYNSSRGQTFAKKFKGGALIAENEFSAIATTWRTIESETLAQSKNHSTFSEEIVKQIVDPIQNWLLTTDKVRKNLVYNGQNSHKTMQTHLQTESTLKTNTDKQRAEAEALAVEFKNIPQDQPRVLARVQSRFSNAKEKQALLEAQYDSVLTNTNLYLEEYYSLTLPKSLTLFENLETQRIEKLAEILRQFVETQIQIPIKYGTMCENIRQKVSLISAKEATEEFLKENMPVNDPPKRVTYAKVEKTSERAPLPLKMASGKILLKKGPIHTVGIFRMTAPRDEVEEIKSKYDTNDTVNFSKYKNPHSVANVLKTYFRELPEPVFTWDLYNQLLETQEIKDPKEMVATLKLLVHTLPAKNFELTKHLINFLVTVTENCSSNKMTSSNLAIVWAPNLLRAKEDTPLQALQDTPIINSLTKELIDNFSDIFLEKNSTDANPEDNAESENQKEEKTEEVENNQEPEIIEGKSEENINSENIEDSNVLKTDTEVETTDEN